jgi:4-hydroxy-tetrahydrodipicolinate reductase
MKKIAVFGICGKMGVSITGELLKEEDIRVVCGLDIVNAGKDFGSLYTGKNLGITICGNYDEVLKYSPDVILDFTNAASAFKSTIWAQQAGIDIIVGATGITGDKLKMIEEGQKNSRSKVFIVPNFSIGAVIMMKMSAAIARYFDDCEIIELHHDRKKDAPSGTAMLTAEYIAGNKIFGDSRLSGNEVETVEGSRGAFYNGINIHSVRLPGYLASQEVIFGSLGQTLKIRHDTIDRLCFYPGVILAIKKIDTLSSLTIGLDKLLSF